MHHGDSKLDGLACNTQRATCGFELGSAEQLPAASESPLEPQAREFSAQWAMRLADRFQKVWTGPHVQVPDDDRRYKIIPH